MYIRRESSQIVSNLFKTFHLPKFLNSNTKMHFLQLRFREYIRKITWYEFYKNIRIFRFLSNFKTLQKKIQFYKLRKNRKIRKNT